MSLRRNVAIASVSLEKRQRRGLFVIEYRGRQRSAEYRRGVEIESIVTQIGNAAFDRRVAVHDQPAVVAAMGQERFADPQQGLLILRIERRAGIDAGVDEKAPAVVVAQAQRT